MRSSFSLLLISVLLLGLSFINALNYKNLDGESEGKLIFAHAIFRHGDRNINRIYPNDPFKDEIHWPGGIGQLTKRGKQQLYDFGLFLSRRYQKLLGDKYSPNKVYIQSTDVDRAIMSAQSALASLFAPKPEEVWNGDLNWQPVPVHTIPTYLDHILLGPKKCAKYDALYAEYLKSSEVQDILTKNADLMEFLSDKVGINVTEISDVFWIHNTLYVEKLYNKQLPGWAHKVLDPKGVVLKIAEFNCQMGSATKPLARLQSGYLIKEIFERFAQKINGTLQPDRTLWLYSAHDLTISNLMNSLGLLQLQLIPYAASVHFELYQKGDSEHYIQFFYRKSEEEKLSPLNIPNCGYKCSLKQLFEVYNDVIPADIASECRI